MITVRDLREQAGIPGSGTEDDAIVRLAFDLCSETLRLLNSYRQEEGVWLDRLREVDISKIDRAHSVGQC
ncbi:hypothetical protein ACVMIX_000694 [Rhizobium leguminosarum]